MSRSSKLRTIHGSCADRSLRWLEATAITHSALLNYHRDEHLRKSSDDKKGPRQACKCAKKERRKREHESRARACCTGFLPRIFHGQIADATFERDRKILLQVLPLVRQFYITTYYINNNLTVQKTSVISALGLIIETEI